MYGQLAWIRGTDSVELRKGGPALLLPGKFYYYIIHEDKNWLKYGSLSNVASPPVAELINYSLQDIPLSVATALFHS